MKFAIIGFGRLCAQNRCTQKRTFNNAKIVKFSDNATLVRNFFRKIIYKYIYMIDLKTFREVNKLTQKDVAEYLGGIGKAFISQVEHGKSCLPTKHLETLLNNDRGWDTSSLLKSGTIIQKIGDNSAHNTQVAGDTELAVCQQKVEYLERILEEKERMIQILLEKK